ncbi:putative uncharacterized protein DDB_G0282499 [Eupeodes corollae]|uniref:putative uncharacterized protein DDB_G0282499 n=1 Tax=Eupeodes corollae TaxID=290404 RepID=UPI0024936FCD|nr:putative uncharacterized protein DDB_G0282499 [Eupeodes corollae]
MKRFRVKRKNEKWVSNNRVLLGSSKKDPGRNPNFDTEETKLLISLWGDPTVQRTLITTHRKHTVIAKLTEQMNEYGYNRSTEEINTRIKNLKCFYNRLKKDMDMGSISGVTWKHFGAMDEIMTRSIFSVRPNEIPKPSLKYQLEQELEEERKKHKGEGASVKRNESSNNNIQILEENASCSSLSSKEENDEPLNNIENGMEHNNKTDGACKIKEEDSLNSWKLEDDEPLIIPKDEPIEEDVQIINENEINQSPERHAPILNEYIQATNNTNSSPGSHFTNSSNNLNANTNSLPKTSQAPSTIPQSIVITNPSNNGISQQGLISLVPTNFLLQQNKKPEPKQIQIRPQPQQRIICAQPKPQTNTGIVSSANNGRMKVLFVNAFQNGNTPNVASSNKEFSLQNPNLINASKTHQTEPTISMSYMENSKPTSTEEPEVNPKDHGFELLFNKLIEMQNENNEIQRQHLELTRQRLEFEKTMADKFLEVLSSLKSETPKESTNNIENSRKRSAHSEEVNNEKSILPDIIDDFNNYHLLTPKVEKID